MIILDSYIYDESGIRSPYHLPRTRFYLLLGPKTLYNALEKVLSKEYAVLMAR